MCQAQAEHALCAGFTVNADGLHFAGGGLPVGQEFVGHAGAGNADAFVGNISACQGAHKAQHITLASAVAAVITDADVGGIGVQQLGKGGFQVGRVLGGVAHHKVLGDAGAAGHCTLGLQVDQVEVLAGQAARCRDGDAAAGFADRELGAGNLAKGGIHCALNLGLAGVAGNERGAVALTQVGQGECVAVGLGVCAQRDGLHLVGVGHTSGDGAHAGGSVGQACGVDADLAGVAVGQGAGEADVQTKEVAGGLAGVVADCHVARANAAQGAQGGLDVLGEFGAVGAVADGSRGLAVVAQGEAAAGGALAGADHQVGQVGAEECPAESDLVTVGCGAGDFHVARTAKGCVQGVAHGGGVGANVDAGGGVGLAVVGKAQGEAARRRGLDQHALDFRFARDAVAGVDVAKRVGLAAHANAFDIDAGQIADKADVVAVAGFAVAGVHTDADVGAGDSFALVAVQKLGVGGLELGDGLGGVFCIVAVVPGGGQHRVVHKVEFEALVAKLFLEGDLVAFVDLGAGIALGQGGHTAVDRAGRGRGVAAEAQALQFAEAFNPGSGLQCEAVSHQEHGVVARRVGAGKDDFVAFIDTGQTLGVGADGHSDRGRGFAQRLQGDLFGLVHTGVGLCLGVLAGGNSRRRGADTQVGNVDAAQGADEFKGVALGAVARDCDVARANALQAFQGGGQRSEDVGVGAGLANGDGGAVGCVAGARRLVEVQCAHQFLRHFQLELGVELDGLGLFCA